MNDKMHSFFSEIYRDNEYRIISKRCLKKDIMQYRLNEQLLQQERLIIEIPTTSPRNTLFIVGLPRSGTTLLAQILAYSLDIGIINNELARYWMAPNIALGQIPLKIKQCTANSTPLISEHGRTNNKLDVSEFGYFWQYWFNHQKHDQLSDESLAQINWKYLKNTVSHLAKRLGRNSLLFKNPKYTNYKILSLYNNLGAKFIHIQRSAPEVTSSIYKARLREYGSEEVWWSIRPENVTQLVSLSPWEQIFHQTLSCEFEISRQLISIPKTHKYIIGYQDLIGYPQKHMEAIANHFSIKHKILESDFFCSIHPNQLRGWESDELENTYLTLRNNYESRYYTT
ncbi:MAG: sulfotransferase [Gammaproteobacteria bacterium]|nr:sulfotransferase [Gammaproteobacteria bacterium]